MAQSSDVYVSLTSKKPEDTGAEPSSTATAPALGTEARYIDEDEYNAIWQAVKASVPKDLDEKNKERLTDSMFWGAYEEARWSPKPFEEGTLTRLLGGMWEMVNPVTAVQGLWSAGRHPITTAGAMYEAQKAQFEKAKEEYEQGRYSEAAGHTLTGAIPLLGPAMAQAGETIASGDVARGVGQTLGLAAPTVVTPSAALQGVKTAAGVLPSAITAPIAGALERGAASRVVQSMVPMVGANKPRFGTKAAKIAPKLLDTPGVVGGWSRAGLRARVGAGLENFAALLDEAHNNRLKARTFKAQEVIDALQAKRDELVVQPIEGSRLIPSVHGQATIPAPTPTGPGPGLAGAARPGAAAGSAGVAAANLPAAAEGTAAAVEGAGARIATSWPEAATTQKDIFRYVEANARRNGFQGTRAELRRLFDEHLASAREYQAEMAATGKYASPTELFRAIADRGGVNINREIAQAGMPGELAHLWESSSGYIPGKGYKKGSSALKRGRTLATGGFHGVPGVLVKEGGLDLDYMAEALRSDPRFQHITGPKELIEAITEARTAKLDPYAGPSLGEALAGVGIKPDTRWWEGDIDLSFDPAEMEVGAAGTPAQAAAAVASPAAAATPPGAAQIGVAPPGRPPTYLGPGQYKVARPIGQPVVPPPLANRVAVIDEAIKKVRSLGSDVRYDQIRDLREAYDIPAKVKYNPSMTQDFLKVQGAAEGAADITGALRDWLGQKDPATGAANAPYSVLKSADDIMRAVEDVERVRPKLGRQLTARLMTMFGLKDVAGAPGMVIGYMLGPFVDNVAYMDLTTRLQTARNMKMLANAIRQDNIGDASHAAARLRRVARAGVLTERAIEQTRPAQTEESATP